MRFVFLARWRALRRRGLSGESTGSAGAQGILFVPFPVLQSDRDRQGGSGAEAAEEGREWRVLCEGVAVDGALASTIPSLDSAVSVSAGKSI